MNHFYIEKSGGLDCSGIPDDVLHRFEKINTRIFESDVDGSRYVADVVEQMIRDSAQSEKPFSIGLTTGNTPVALYKELVDRYNAGRISFRNVRIYSLEEFYGLAKDDPRTHGFKLHKELLDNIDILPQNIISFDPSLEMADMSSFCTDYEKAADDIDLIIVGVGPQGQIGFNDVGSHAKTKTRMVPLTYKNIVFQSSKFQSVNEVPKIAVTMGIDTMMRADRIIMMAWGEEKAEAVKNIVEGVDSDTVPATHFQNHPYVEFVVDKDSASELTVEKTPWVIGNCEWTSRFIRRAVIWLSEKVHKPILELTLEDYCENYLSGLIDAVGSYSKINIDVFNDIQHTISGWPGGKPNADDTNRPVPANPFPKKIVIFSPHPDDDVISMGGTFGRLIDNGHNVHVAYETSGNVAVHDDVVLQNIDTAREMGFGDRYNQVKNIVESRDLNAPQPRELLDIKGSIRRAEARAAVRELGLDDRSNAHFLNLPFYETGGIKKGEVSEDDFRIVRELLQEIQPDQIYAAGDFYDPHGTHKTCTNIVLTVLNTLWDESWVRNCEIWLYRGAWKEWSFADEDMAVPISPEEVIKKRHAVFKHLSQKDVMPFPGEDTREFWQRAEDRNMASALALSNLGLAKYQAMELFVRMRKR